MYMHRNSYKGISINTSKNTHERVFELIGLDTNLSLVDIPSGKGAFVQRLKDAGFKKACLFWVLLKESILEWTVSWVNVNE